jgi:uroporphyrinogen-III synthase
VGAPRSPRAIAVLSAPGTLAGIEPRLERAGVRVSRIPTIVPTPVAWDCWRARVDRIPRVDAVVVTSRSGVTAGVRPWLKHSAPTARSVDFWAIGPTTLRALRAAGVRRVRQPPTVGSLALAREFARKPPLTVLYFRSDRAGPALARRLRRLRHHVFDVVVYRLGPAPKLTAAARRDLASADLWIATSPSSLDALRARLGARRFAQLARGAGLVVLGERTRKAAVAHGFRRVSIAPATTTQRFTQHLLSELRDARP